MQRTVIPQGSNNDKLHCGSRHCGLDPQSHNNDSSPYVRYRVKRGMTKLFLLT
ncbi:MAG: hypothetical protein LBR81_00700 [Prevotellaceae bacterium]|nr:hypothetical protein [Prevotellaceae bacterium]